MSMIKAGDRIKCHCTRPFRATVRKVLPNGSLDVTLTSDMYEAEPFDTNVSDVGHWELDEGDCPGPVDSIDAILDQRQGEYGTPEVNFARIAGMWNGLFKTRLAEGEQFSPRDVALAMIAVKCTREFHKHKPDSLDDIEGYVRCIRKIEEA